MTQLEVYGDELDLALTRFRDGGFVLLHDSVDRENEVDMVTAAELMSPEHVAAMRTDAGGLLCLALGHEVAERLKIPGMREILQLAARHYPVLKSLDEEIAPYGGKSPFSITINHRDTFTGITDRDRALTIRQLGELCKIALKDPEVGRAQFATKFKAPGHVHLLIESEGSISQRRGHTELSVYLSRLAGMSPATAICEMLDRKTHNALSVEDARKYALNHSIPLLEGQQLVANFLKEHSQ